MLSLRAVKLFSSLVLAALFGTALFAASVTVSSEPASGHLYVNFNCNRTVYIAAGTTVTFDARAAGCYTGTITNCRNSFTTSGTSRIQSVSTNSGNCVHTIVAKATFPAGAPASEGFIINADTSSGGYIGAGNPFASSRQMTVTVFPPPASDITFTAPTDLAVGINSTQTIDALDYVTETHASYTITCADATSVDSTKLTSVTRITTGNGCNFTITPISTLTASEQGSASFTVPYTSSGGDTHNGVISIEVGTASNITFTAPTDLTVFTNSTLTIDASTYASDGDYTISCGTATESSTLISISSQTDCSIVVAAGANEGTAEISVPYSSSGGASSTNTISVRAFPASDITFTAPTGLQVGVNRTQTIDALEYVTETHASYTVTCGDATSVDSTKLASVTRITTGNGCGFTITPISTLTTSQQGSASFTVPYMSSGGDTEDGVISIEVGPESTITFQDRDLWVTSTATTYEVSANLFASDPGYTISCGAVTVFDSDEISGVTQASAGSCRYSVALTGTAGRTSFNVPYMSSGGDSVVETLTMTVAVSSVVFTAPAVTPAVATSGTVVIDARPFVRDGGFTIDCATATSVSSSISSITRANNCEFTVTAGSTADASASFTVPYTSSGGATANGVIPVNIGQTSNVSYTAPTGLKVGAGNTRTFDLSSAATDGGYVISCGAASSVSASITVASTGCDFAVTAGSTQGTATFTVRFTSAGGDTHDGVVSVEVGAASALAFNSPSDLTLGTRTTKRIDLSSYATDGDYKVECGDPQNIRNAAFARVIGSISRPFYLLDGTYDALSCVFEVTARDTQAAATFSMQVKSEATDTPITAMVTITVGAASEIVISGVPAPFPPTLPAAMPAIAKLDRNDCGRFTAGVTSDISDCQVLVDLQNHWATEANRNLPMDHPLRTWGTSSVKLDRWQGVRIGTPPSSPTQPAVDPVTPNDGRVLELDLSSLGIRGTLPDWFGSGGNPRSGVGGAGLEKLRSLSLNGNYLTGEMPSSLNDLSESQDIGVRTGRLGRFGFCFNYFRGSLPALLTDTDPKSRVQRDTFSPSSLFAAGNIPCQLAGSPPAVMARSSAWTYARVGTGTEKRITAWIEGLGLAGDYYELNPIQYWNQEDGEWDDTTEHTCLERSTIDSACVRSRETALPAGSFIRWINGYYDTATLSGLNLTNVSLSPGLGSAKQGDTIRFDASRYASDGSYAITCDTDYVEDFAFSSATQSGTDNCTFELEVDPDADVTEESFPLYAYLLIGFTSAGGDKESLSLNFFITESSAIVYTPAEDLHTEDGLTVTLDASVFSPFTAPDLECEGPLGANIGNADSLITAVRDGCDFTVTAAAGATPSVSTDFKVYYRTGDGRVGLTEFIFSIATSEMTLIWPTGLTVAAGRAIEIDAGRYATDGRYGITCGTPTGVDATKLTVTQPDRSDSCVYRIAAQSSAAEGATSFTVPYTSSGGGTHNGTVTLIIGPASDITFTPPTGLARGRDEQISINALDYVTDTGDYTIGCSDAQNIASSFQGVVRLASALSSSRDCVFNIGLGRTQGTATFTIPYISEGGDTHQGQIQIRTGPDSQITFTDPGTLTVGRNRTLVIDALDHATEANGHLIECKPATGVDASKMTVTRSGCEYTVDPVDTLAQGDQGDTTFQMSYTTGQATTAATFTINIGPDSAITYVAPVGLERGSNYRTYTIDAADYATETSPAAYTITCGDATDIDTREITSIARSANSCSYTITLNGVQGVTSFAVPYKSTGNHALNGVISLRVGPASSIVFSAPQPNLAIGSSLARSIDMSDYATDGSYTITCGTIATSSALVTLGAQNGCSIPITSGTTAGTAQITVPYTSSGGATQTRTISVGTAAASDIVFTAPDDLKVARNRTRTINALDYATDGGYPINCGDATGVDNDKLASVTRSGCDFTITPVSTLTDSQQGAAAFTVPYTSAGTDTHDGVFSIEVGPDSTITFTAPAALLVAKNRALAVDASSYATEASPSDYAISCGDATSIDTIELRAVTHPADSCAFIIYPNNVEGSASFTVPYMSEGGHSVDGAISVTVGPDSQIAFTAPAGLSVRGGGTLTINALDHIRENSAYTVTCADAASIDTARLASVTRDGCAYTVTAANAGGRATFTVPYASSGGDTHNGIISLTVIAPSRPDPQPGGQPGGQTQQPIDTTPIPSTTTAPEAPEPEEPEPTDVSGGWNTFTVQGGGTTARTIRQRLGLPTNQAFYIWDTETQAWTRVTSLARTIPAGTTVSFFSERGLGAEELEVVNLGYNTQEASLASGWNIINTAEDIVRVRGRDFLVDDALIDCDRLQGVVAVTNYNPRTRRWSLWLPCHPRVEARYTTGIDPAYDPLTTIGEGDTTYIYIRSRIPVEITWNPNTQTYQFAS